MASPLLEDEGLLREWTPLADLLQQIPAKAQRGIFTQDLYLTCVDILPEFIAVGTNLGLVYWYGRRKGDLQRLRCENTASAITCVKIVSTVEFMVAAGTEAGIVTVFQIPKEHPDCIPDSLKPAKSKQVERYTISGLHSSPVTAIEWSMNGMKLFSGDKNGLVVLTEIDFYMHLSKSVELLNEKYEIVQLSYSRQLLLVSTLYRSIVCHRDDKWRVAQVGQRERKTLGKLGATFSPGSGRPQDIVVYSTRPGLRLWLADKNGIVQQTLIFKDALTLPYPEALLINPAPAHLKKPHPEHVFGPLLVFRENLLVTYSADVVYILDPATISIVATVSDLRGVKGIAVNKDEIFILEGERSLIRVGYLPDPGLTLAQGYNQEESGEDSTGSAIPVSLSDVTLASSFLDLTSKLKDSAVVPAVPFQSIFNSGLPSFGSFSKDWNPIVTADEAQELPPIINLPMDSLVGLHTEGATSDGHKNLKEVYNHSQRSTLDALQEANNSRGEVLDKIGEEDYENILFKPKTKKKIQNAKPSWKKHVVAETESGSDTMSTNSARSAASDCEDLWSSERLDVSSEWSSFSSRLTSEDRNRVHQSASEDTLVRLDDSITGNLGSVQDENYFSEATDPSLEESPNIQTRPDILHNLNMSLARSPLLDIKPDLRSPASIERDVADKERILAKVLNLDTLCLDHTTEPDVLNSALPSENGFEIISDERSHDLNVDNSKSEECENPCAGDEGVCNLSYESDAPDEKHSSMSSMLNYGPPSGSSAPPSAYASLELSEPTVEFKSSDIGMYEALDRADKWMQYKVPDQITNLSVCRNYVCCIDCKDLVYYSRLTGLGLKWQKLDYKAKQVVSSINGSIVWKLVKDVVYALDNPSSKGPFGKSWHEAANDILFISVDEAIGWLVSLDGRVFVQKQLSAKRPYSVSVPVSCPWPVTQISSLNGAVWALTNVGEVIARIGMSAVQPEGKDWRRIIMPSPVATGIALGAHRTGWVIDSKNLIYFTNDYTAPQPKWWEILVSDYIFQQSTALQQFRNKLTDNYLLNLRTNSVSLLAVSDDTVWIAEKLTTSVHMNKAEFSGHQWSRVVLKCYLPSIKWQEVTAEGIFENKGQLWLLSTAGDLFCLPPNSQNLHALGLPSDSPVACIAATPQSMWLLSTQGRIYIRRGLTDTCIDGTLWKELSLEQIGGVHLTYISCGCDVVWGCDKQGDVYMAVGSPHSMAVSAFAPVWIIADEKPQKKHIFTRVFVGPQTYMVWAIDNKRNVYVREGIFNDFQLGTDWVLVSGIEAVQLSVSGTAVWALSPCGSIYRRYGISQNNYIGDYWQKIPGTATAITVSVSDELWALDKSVDLLRHSQLTVTLSGRTPPPRLVDSGAAGGIDDTEWEVV